MNVFVVTYTSVNGDTGDENVRVSKVFASEDAANIYCEAIKSRWGWYEYQEFEVE